MNKFVLAATTLGDKYGEPRSKAADQALRSGKLSRLRPGFFLPENGDSIRLFHINKDNQAKIGHFRASKKRDTCQQAHEIKSQTLVIHGALD